jgi:RNA ligase (TIGR02306 family)
MAVAYIGKVVEVNPIEGADRIESVVVVCGGGGKWRGTAQKGLHHIDELVEVYIQDAILPQTERFAFMEKHHWRVSMKKFKGVPSECLIMPLDVSYWTMASIESERVTNSGLLIGTIIPNIEKYEKPIPPNMAGEVYGNFPTHLIPKTDEPNFQSAPQLVEALKGKRCFITVKCDGCSATFYNHNGHFGCCSRNLELKDSPNNSMWRLARAYGLIEKLPNGTAIQAEIVGPGVLKNTMELKEVDMRVFNVYDILNRKYLDYHNFLAFTGAYELPTVPLAYPVGDFNVSTEEELRKLAEGNYENGHLREGIVIRPVIEEEVLGERLSFKVINLSYKN